MRSLTALLCLTFAVLLLSAGEGFALPPCPEDPTQRFHNCFGTYTYPSGAKYVGEWRDDKQHGQGTFTYPSGQKYVGEYRDNESHGQGTHTWPSGQKYVGEFRDGKQHGQGTVTFPSGQKYVGEWRDDKQHGQGTHTWPDGREYVGEFRDDKMHGQGTYTHADGEVWQGTFANDDWVSGNKYSRAEWRQLAQQDQGSDLPPCPEDPTQRFHNCFGTYTTPDGDKYVGEWRDDKAHGQGTYTTANGDKYIGEWRDDEKHGQGTITFADGEKYVGEFRDDKMHGQGTYTHADGEVWQGTFANDDWVSGNKYSRVEWRQHEQDQGSDLPPCPEDPTQRFHNCFGTYTTANGEVYVGEWRDDKAHGQGTQTWASGDKYVGEFRDGKAHGQGTYTFADGDKYVGGWRDDKMHGQGTHTWGSGEKYVGGWRDDKKHGQGIYTWPDGEKYVGEFRDNLYNGQGTYTHADGEVWQGTFANDDWVSGNKYSRAEWRQHEQEHIAGERAAPPELTTIDAPYVALKNANVRERPDVESERVSVLPKGTEVTVLGKVKGKNWYLVSRDGQRLGYVYGALLDEIEAETIVGEQQEEVIPASSGTGFTVSSSGHIVTNNHVIEGCENVKVHQRGNVHNATVVANDRVNDLALIQAAFVPLAIFAISNDNAVLTQDILVAGYPFGEDLSSSVKVTSGIVSSLTGLGDNYSEMQIDAALQPGNSGGPIIDEKGNIVGVAVAKLDLEIIYEAYGVIPENTNFGIKSSVLRSFLEANGIKMLQASNQNISREELGTKVTNGTLLLSCWMTYAQIEKLKAKKVLFQNLQ